MADNQNEIQPLSDASKERIKLTAGFANGVAIGCFVVGGLSVMVKLVTENGADDGMLVLMFLSSVLWFILSIVFHAYGLRHLGGLDE